MAPTASTLGGVDPSATGNIVRVALAIESALTVGVGVYYTFFPRHYLLYTMGAAASQVTTTAVQSAQQFGAANIFVGGFVGLFTANTRTSIEGRPILYLGALVWEVLYIPLVLWQAFMMEGGMQPKALMNALVPFVTCVFWRTFTLVWKPQWLGRYLDGKKIE